MPTARPFPSRTAWDAACHPSRFQFAAAPRDCRGHTAPVADRRFLSTAAGNMDLPANPASLRRQQPVQSLLAPVPPTSPWRLTAPTPPASPYLPVPSAMREILLRHYRNAPPTSAPSSGPNPASTRLQATPEYEL